MLKRLLTLIVIAGAASLFAGCGGEKISFEVKARMDGKPAAQARVTVDGVDEGVTGADGSFVKVLERKAGSEVAVVVTKEQPGYRTKPWTTSFVVKRRQTEGMDRYAYEAEIPPTRYVTIVAKEKGAPVAEAAVLAAGKEAGKTGAAGEFEYDYPGLPAEGIELAVTKAGYRTSTRKGPLEPGQRIEAELSKRVIVTVTALTEEYGLSSGIPGWTKSLSAPTHRFG